MINFLSEINLFHFILKYTYTGHYLETILEVTNKGLFLHLQKTGIYRQLKFEGKIPTVQKLCHSQGITQNFEVSRPI